MFRAWNPGPPIRGLPLNKRWGEAHTLRMAQVIGLIVMLVVAGALVVIVSYGCFTIVQAVLTAVRPRPVDLLADELDTFLVGLLGPRDPAVGPGREGTERSGRPD